MFYHAKSLKNAVHFMSMIVFFLVLLISNMTSGITRAQDVNTLMYPVDSSPFGISFDKWTAEWWQSNVMHTLAEHPRDNFSPEKCNLGQNGPVWFLPDILNGEEERTCLVPEGKAVLIPIITGICWNDGNPKFMTDEELLNCAKEGQIGAFINAYVNGEKLNEISNQEIVSPFFNLTVPFDSFVRYHEDANGNAVECTECPVGTFRAAADGFYIFLEPLPEGTYEIRFSYDTLGNPISEYRTAASLVYNLVVGSS